MTWTKCEDALPEQCETCLVYGQNADIVSLGYLLLDRWCSDHTEETFKTQPTHWMTLPDPPK